MENLRCIAKWIICANLCCTIVFASENNPSGLDYLREASELYNAKQYFKAARYAFAASQEDSSLKPDAYAWIALGLINSGLPNAASYFFIRTLQSGHRPAIKSVLTHTEDLMMIVGADVIRKYLIRHTSYDDYNDVNRNVYLYSLGKDTLLAGDPNRAIGYLSGIQRSSAIWPFAMQLRGTARALLDQNREAIEDFKVCAAQASRILNIRIKDSNHRRQLEREADDLESRCIAGHARTLYQMDEFNQADRVYDSISKKSFVWPDTLFEQAWNSFAKQEYNRSLGKLVTYKSPALQFVYNSEVDVLRAQSFLALCLYSDANEVINEFNANYTSVGVEVKTFVESNADHLGAFYEVGKSALRSSIYTSSYFYRLMNRFVRGPYFQSMVSNEDRISKEMNAIQRLDAEQSGIRHGGSQGFPGFLGEVLRWRLSSIQLLGGAFVKNSLLDYHKALIDDFEKIAFIKLEMLKNSKDSLMSADQKKEEGSTRLRGNVFPDRRDDQYRWIFNGEFWSDELGDYVFGLESACKS